MCLWNLEYLSTLNRLECICLILLMENQVGSKVSRNGHFGFVLVDVESRNWGKWVGVEQS